MSDTKVIGDIIKQALTVFGKIDILVNNAGIIRRMDAIDFSEKDWDDVMSLNLKTVFFFSQAAAKTIHQPENGRENNQCRLHAFFPGRNSSSILHRQQKRRHGNYKADGKRMGEIQYQCECDRAGIYGNGQHGATACRPGKKQGTPGKDTRRKMGHAGGSQGNRCFPCFRSISLYYRVYDSR